MCADTATSVRLEDVYKSYGSGELQVRILSGANLDLIAGRFYSIFGPSGCGKTTLLNIIGGIDKSDAGRVIVAGEDLTKMTWSKLARFRRHKVGFVFQFYNLIPTLTALENVEAGIDMLSSKRKEVRQKAVHYLEKVGLADRLHKYPDKLSGGEQQRVAIARALAKEPEIILADEPTGNLDESNAMKIAEVMIQLHREFKGTYLVVTHNQRISQMADAVFYISNGKILGV